MNDSFRHSEVLRAEPSLAPDPAHEDESATRAEPCLARAPAAGAADPDLQEVVQRFEALYSGLVPPPGPVVRPPETDDVDFDLGGVFPAEPPPGPRASSREEPSLRRPVDRSDTFGEDPSIDEAMAILRQAEARGPSGVEAAPAARHEVAGSDAAMHADAPPSRNTGAGRWSDLQAPVLAFDARPPARASGKPVVPGQSWAERRRASAWPKVAAAAVIALFVGVAAGVYIAHEPDTTTVARIETNARGEAQLRVDYQLGR